MNCPKCNAVNNQDAKFCGSCGNNLSAATQTNINNEAEEILETEEPVITGNIQQEMQTQVTEHPVMVQTEQTSPATNVVPQPINNIEQQSVNEVPQQPQQPKSKKTLVILIGGFIAISAIIVSVVLLLNMSPAETKQEKEKIDAIFNPNQLIRVKKNDKYGYINTKGEVEIPITYEYATDFKGNHAVVRTEIEKDGMIKTVSQIIDSKGKVKKVANESIEYIEETESWIIDQELYNKSMKKISPKGVRVSHEKYSYYLWVNSENNTGGLMNDKGKQVYTYNFNSGEDSIYTTIANIDESQKERYCIINIESKFGIINCDTGVEVREMTEDRITSDSDNVFTIKNGNSYDFKEIIYIQNDKIMYQSTNEEVDLYYYPGYVSIRDGSKETYDEMYSYLNLETGEVQTTKPESSTTNEHEDLEDWEKLTGNKTFSCGVSGYGLMNDEVITLPCEWKSLSYLETNLYKYLESNGKEYIYGKKENKWYLIDLKEKKAIVEFNSSYIYKEDNTTFIYYTDATSNGKKVYNLLTNKSISIDNDKRLTIYSNYITVKDSANEKQKYYNTELEMIYEGDI